jgi:cytochrome c oxidase assembly factor 6
MSDRSEERKQQVDERVLGSSRQVCWQARDVYFACLDAHNIALPSTRQQLSNDAASLNAMRAEIRRHCQRERNALEEHCLASWIRHFEQRRAFEGEKSARMQALQARDKKEAESKNLNTNASDDNDRKKSR